jgi:hypothetical protein
MRAVRVLRQFKSRSKHRHAPSESSFEIVKDGVRETITRPLADAPILLQLPIFEMPGCTRDLSATDLRAIGFITVNYGARVDTLKESLGAERLTITPGANWPVDFARMVAKIALAHATATRHVESLRERFPLGPVILGEATDIGRWVGTLKETPRIYPGVTHRLALKTNKDEAVMWCEVQLFADNGGPTFLVFLGTL